jgi:opacity protein-like surface antigen
MYKIYAALAAVGVVSLAAGAAPAQEASTQANMPAWLNGFYVRGDLGGAIGDATKFHDTNPGSKSAFPIVAPSTAEAETGISAFVGGGIGYRFNRIFRSDLTFSWMPGLSAKPVSSGTTGAGFSYGSANLDSLVGLANGYVQLDGLLPASFGAFQPYIDGGIGLARNHLATLAVDGIPPDAVSGATKTNFAWAVGAGVAYPITSQLSVDFAYRFLNIGPIATGNTGISSLGTGFSITAMKSEDVTVHTITAGLRWNFGPIDPNAAGLMDIPAFNPAWHLFSWVPNGVYIRGDLGAAFGNKLAFRGTGPISPPLPNVAAASAKLDNSAIFGAGIGYRISPLLRADLTIDDMPSLHGSGTSSGLFAGSTASADIHSLVGLANGYIDLNGLFPNLLGPVQPFIDGSVGVARNEISPATGLIRTGGAALASYAISGAARTNFAWGVGGGVGYALSPNLTVELAYKYLDLGPVETGGSVQLDGFTALPIPKLRSNDLTVHTVTAGLRWSFGAPPAPPPAMPVAAPASPPPAAIAPAKQMFIVFFEFDKSALTADGKKVVDAAAAAYKTGKPGVAIAGYTDLAGTQQYNLALSKRRADMVKSALVKDGVPASAIDESWHGKENPRVPTADGVREPQNRRVEIAM